MNSKNYKEIYEPLARKAAIKYGVDPNLFAAQIQQESGFNPNAGSSAGAKGIAQIIPSTAKSWNVNPLDPVAALDAAAKNMSKYFKTYLNNKNLNPNQDQLTAYKYALAAYNAGAGAVQKHGSKIIDGKTGIKGYDSETANYIKNITKSFKPVDTKTNTTKPQFIKASEPKTKNISSQGQELVSANTKTLKPQKSQNLQKTFDPLNKLNQFTTELKSTQMQTPDKPINSQYENLAQVKSTAQPRKTFESLLSLSKNFLEPLQSNQYNTNNTLPTFQTNKSPLTSYLNKMPQILGTSANLHYV